MPSSFLSRTSSAIFSISFALLTWYGISVTTICDLFGSLLLDHRTRAHDDRAAARLCTALMPRRGRRCSRRSGSRGLDDASHSARSSASGFVDQRERSRRRFREVVRRNVRRHADRDAGRSVDQQVRKPRRQNDRLDARVVEVGTKVDGLLVDVRQHLDRRSARGAPRCTDTRPADRRRSSRSCRGRRPADSAA